MRFENLSQRLQSALKEDAVSADRTTLAIPNVKKTTLTAKLMAKQKGVLAGGFLLPLIYKRLDRHARIQLLKRDGAKIKAGETVARLKMSAPALLGGERLMLNLLCHLSGVATHTNHFVDAVKGTSAKILDTRKTTPLWRDLEKYAVTCGGGVNHRDSLGDAILVKDNHLQLLRERGLTSEKIYGAKSTARKKGNYSKFLAMEAATIPEVWSAIKARPDIILLDNMTLNRLKAAIVFVKAAREALNSPMPLIEVSGGITLQKAKDYARLGVDRISVGALTHSAPAMDFSLEVL